MSNFVSFFEVYPHYVRDVQSYYLKGKSVLFSCIDGSRAYGLNHTESDYDVRYVFIDSVNFYLGLDEPVLTASSLQISENVELKGHDLKKLLRLVTEKPNKPNPSLYEWIKSPLLEKDTFYNEEINSIKTILSEIDYSTHYFGLMMGLVTQAKNEYNMRGFDYCVIKELCMAFRAMLLFQQNQHSILTQSNMMSETLDIFKNSLPETIIEIYHNLIYLVKIGVRSHGDCPTDDQNALMFLNFLNDFINSKRGNFSQNPVSNIKRSQLNELLLSVLFKK